MGYLTSWSAHATYLKQHPGEVDILIKFRELFMQALGSADDSKTIILAWPIFMILARMRSWNREYVKTERVMCSSCLNLCRVQCHVMLLKHWPRENLRVSCIRSLAGDSVYRLLHWWDVQSDGLCKSSRSHFTPSLQNMQICGTYIYQSSIVGVLGPGPNPNLRARRILLRLNQIIPSEHRLDYSTGGGCRRKPCPSPRHNAYCTQRQCCLLSRICLLRAHNNPTEAYICINLQRCSITLQHIPWYVNGVQEHVW